MIVFFAVQLLHSLADTNTWPFCSYNMFNKTVPCETQRLMVRLHCKGCDSELQEVWGMLPLEFFRVTAITHRVYFDGDEPTKRMYSQRLCEYLRTVQWSGFDETYASLRCPDGRTLTGFDIVLVDVQLGGGSARADQSRGRLLYTYSCAHE